MPQPVPPFPSRGVDRRALLLGAGLGAGMLAAGTGRAAAAGRLAPADPPAPGSLPLTGGDDFPIGVFWPPPPYESTAARYQEIADAGFTFVITGNYLFDARSAAHALGLADQVGLKVLVADDPRMLAMAHYLTVTDDRSVPSSLTTADATAWTRAALDAYTAHPSFAGFSLYDEPPATRFPTVGALAAILRGLAPGLLPYVNINRGNGSAYADFVQRFVDAVRPSLISFDRYPILADGSIDTAYFDTWAIIREAALTAGIPAWTYIQSTGFNGHAVPTPAQLAWQINTSLAYGCKGIQYFTYWTPDPARGEGYTQALITTDGRQTPLYQAARTLNTTWLQPTGRQLKPLTTETVHHANEPQPPTGTTPFTPGTHLTHTTGDPALLTLYTHPNQQNDTRHLLITNRHPDKPATLRVGLNPLYAAARYDPAGDRYAPVAARSGVLDVSLAPGAAALYRLSAT